ncbi:MAG TPA: tetratricopeptide repeat protein, partial [Candidatus Acidoferrum sp.]|nr:tetratricopeptide repeat protein [Candidatus Acidoferrum sp.]
MLFYFGSRTVILVASVLLLSSPSFAQNAETYRKQAIELSRAKSWDAAIADYRKALELEPNDADTHYNLALTLKYRGESRQAAEEFEEAVRLKPSWAAAHFGLGATQFDLGDQAAAVKELQAALRLDPAHVNSRELIARIDLQQNNPSSAEVELKKALATKPSAELHFELGLVEGQLGKLDVAAAQFRQGIALDPKFARAHAVLGV